MSTKKEIDSNSIIDSFINKELEVQPNPYLVSKVMVAIERERMRVVVLQKFAIAAGIVLALFSGILLGNVYNTPIESQTTALLINDSYIENLELFTEQQSNNL